MRSNEQRVQKTWLYAGKFVICRRSAGKSPSAMIEIPQRPHAMLLQSVRDLSPRAKSKDEDMVLRVEETKSEIPCQVSSDAHEWRNDWTTVSGICSVKIQYR